VSATIRNVAPGFFWIAGCTELHGIDGEPIHVQGSVFVILGERETMVVDVGLPPRYDRIADDIEEILAGRPLNWIMPTHAEVPHAGNAALLLERFPGSRLVAGVYDYHLYFPEHIEAARVVRPGDEIDLGGGFGVTALEAFIYDVPGTLWVYEKRNKIMFVADAFSYAHSPNSSDDDEDADPTHKPGQCLLFSTEYPEPVTVNQAKFITRASMYYTRFKDVQPALDKLVATFENYPPDYIAPAHGNLIANVDTFVDLIRETHRQVYGEFLVSS